MKIRFFCALILLFAFATQTFGQALKILPLGDSVTASFAGQSSYRYWLWHMMQAAGYEVDFVGSQQGVVGGDPLYPDFDQDHEGRLGWHADEALTVIDEVAAAQQPDIVLLDLGANDVEQGETNKSTIEELRLLIEALREANPNVLVLIAQPRFVKARQKQLGKLNSSIRRLAAQMNRPESRVVAVNMYSGFNAKKHTFDGIHLNEAGDKKMAERWFAALQKVL